MIKIIFTILVLSCSKLNLYNKLSTYFKGNEQNPSSAALLIFNKCDLVEISEKLGKFIKDKKNLIDSKENKKLIFKDGNLISIPNLYKENNKEYGVIINRKDSDEEIISILTEDIILGNNKLSYKINSEQFEKNEISNFSIYLDTIDKFENIKGIIQEKDINNRLIDPYGKKNLIYYDKKLIAIPELYIKDGKKYGILIKGKEKEDIESIYITTDEMNKKLGLVENQKTVLKEGYIGESCKIRRIIEDIEKEICKNSLNKNLFQSTLETDKEIRLVYIQNELTAIHRLYKKNNQEYGIILNGEKFLKVQNAQFKDSLMKYKINDKEITVKGIRKIKRVLPRKFSDKKILKELDEIIKRENLDRKRELELVYRDKELVAIPNFYEKDLKKYGIIIKLLEIEQIESYKLQNEIAKHSHSEKRKDVIDNLSYRTEIKKFIDDNFLTRFIDMAKELELIYKDNELIAILDLYTKDDKKYGLHLVPMKILEIESKEIEIDSEVVLKFNEASEIKGDKKKRDTIRNIGMNESPKNIDLKNFIENENDKEFVNKEEIKDLLYKDDELVAIIDFYKKDGIKYSLIFKRQEISDIISSSINIDSSFKLEYKCDDSPEKTATVEDIELVQGFIDTSGYTSAQIFKYDIEEAMCYSNQLRKKLEDIGFNSILVSINEEFEKLESIIKEFEKSTNYYTKLFYYSGHGSIDSSERELLNIGKRSIKLPHSGEFRCNKLYRILDKCSEGNEDTEDFKNNEFQDGPLSNNLDEDDNKFTYRKNPVIFDEPATYIERRHAEDTPAQHLVMRRKDINNGSDNNFLFLKAARIEEQNFSHTFTPALLKNLEFLIYLGYRQNFSTEDSMKISNAIKKFKKDYKDYLGNLSNKVIIGFYPVDWVKGHDMPIFRKILFEKSSDNRVTQDIDDVSSPFPLIESYNRNY